MSNYIERLFVKQVRHLRDVDISIGKNEDESPRHLILTGPNGSGKTSLLQAILAYLQGSAEHKRWLHEPEWKNRRDALQLQIEQTNSQIQNAPGSLRLQLEKQRDLEVQELQNLDVQLKHLETLELVIPDRGGLFRPYLEGKVVIAFFGAKRKNEMSRSQTIRKIDLKERYAIEAEGRIEFLEYIVGLNAKRAFASTDGDHAAVDVIDRWFARFTQALKDLYGDSALELLFDRDAFNYRIQLSDGREPFDLNQLSDGYNAVLSVVTELVIRMERLAPRTFDLPGIVLIDEIETHLHIELQRKILPFLTTFFPKVQFIVTTHSPFVLTSISNATIFDLSTKTKVEDLTGYSSQAVLEGYFGQSKYSEVLQAELAEYRDLARRKASLGLDEFDRLEELKDRLRDLPKAFSPELEMALQEIEGTETILHAAEAPVHLDAPTRHVEPGRQGLAGA
jgi:predicted ATP-binding protein involved in virulence